MTSTQPPSSRFAQYKQALAAISQRTRTPLPSLIVSFAVVHELTALVPITGFFFGARALGVGESFVGALAPRPGSEPANGGFTSQVRDSWFGERFREWMVEGEARAERVGRKYGWFGFEKGSKPVSISPEAHDGQSVLVSEKIAGDIANAVVAYALTKAILPIRVGVSLYLAPGFSRAVVQPIGSAFSRIFRRTS